MIEFTGVHYPKSAILYAQLFYLRNAAFYASEETTDRPIFEAWPAKLAGGGLTLVAPRGFHGSYIRTHMIGRLPVVVPRVDHTL